MNPNFQLPLPWPVLAGAALVFMIASYFLLTALDKQERLKARISRVTGQQGPEIEAPRTRDGAQVLDALANFGAALAKSGVLSDSTRRQLEQTMAQAGLRGSRVFGLFIGSKVLLMISLPTLVYLSIASHMSGTNFYGVMGGALAVGMLAPDFFIKNMRKKHLRLVEKGLPDALDMMVICAQAGLGLETAIDRVAQEFVFANKAVALELAICASEMRIGTDRRVALLALGERTGIDAMRRLAGTLIQTMQFGTPLSQALRVLAAEMRQDNLTKFEERAARLPVFLTIPMIVFILPCVFIVVGGPAGLEIVKTFSSH
jgi:tight adherence protein C